MAHKQVLFRSAAREKILRGATQLADAVRVTLGPRSKAVLIEKKWGAPIVCNDGVTIAKEFDLKDPEENLGARMLRQAAERTGDSVGDGTSTATILAHAILADGIRNVVAGASAIDIKRGLDRAMKAAIEALRSLSRPVATRKEKAQVAAISAHNDPAIGELVAEAKPSGMRHPPTLTAIMVSRRTRRISGHSPDIPNTVRGWTRISSCSGIRTIGILIRPPSITATAIDVAVPGSRWSLARLMSITSLKTNGNRNSKNTVRPSDSRVRSIKLTPVAHQQG
jgi:hypothetical protein